MMPAALTPGANAAEEHSLTPLVYRRTHLVAETRGVAPTTGLVWNATSGFKAPGTTLASVLLFATLQGSGSAGKGRRAD